MGTHQNQKLVDYVWKEFTLPPGALNLAASSSGVVASASTSLYPPSGSINGQRTLSGWGRGNGWQAKSEVPHPNWWGDWLLLTFPEPRRMDTVVVYAFPEHVKGENQYALKNYSLQTMTDAGWETIDIVEDNTMGILVHRFSEREVKELRLWFRQRDSRVVEVEAYHLEKYEPWREEKRQVRIPAGPEASIAILKDEFPSVSDNSPSSPDDLADLMRSAGYNVTILDGRDISSAEVLNKQNFEMFVQPYGSLFPLGSALYEFLSAEGHLLALGGHSFTNALQWEEGHWVATGWDPGLTVSVTENGDYFVQQRDQLALFGAPGHSLSDVAYIAASPDQQVIKRTIKRDGRVTGPSAVAVTGDIVPLEKSSQDVREGRADDYVQNMREGVSRGRVLRTPGWFTPSYHPLLAQPSRRWVPLVSAYDAYGRIRGTVGAALLNHGGIYRNSRWAYFGADNLDLFAPGEDLRLALLDIIAFLLKDLTLHTVQTDFDCYQRGETATLSAIIDNSGEQERTAEIAFSVLSADKGLCVHTHRETLTLKPGEWVKIVSAWKVDSSEEDLYHFQAALSVDGQVFDSEQFGFVVWNEDIVAAGPKLDYNDNYFSMDGERRFLMGVRDDGFHLHGQTKENSIWWDRQFVMMRECGQDVFSPVYISVFVEGFGWGQENDGWIPEKLLRVVDAQVQLSQKHGIVMGITVFFIGEDEAIYKPERSRKLCAALGERYKAAPGIMFYIFDDGHREDPELFNNWARECRAGFDESGRNYLVTAEWSAVWNGLDTFRDGSRELDFVSISCYSGLAEFPEAARLLEMRSIGKNFTNAEFGRQASTGSLADKHAYLIQPHHQFGMGHAMTVNWKWKDNDHAIFPWGIVFPGDWVPKDVFYLYRNSAFFFRQFHPTNTMPPLVVLLPRVHFTLNYKKVCSYLLNLLRLLIEWGADFTVIDEVDVDRLPPATRAVIYPAPHRAPDHVYSHLQQFVNRGGYLWLAGKDEAWAEDNESGRALRALIGKNEVVRNVSYSVDDSLEFATAHLPDFLSASGIFWRERNAQGVDIFKLSTDEATVYTLTAHRWDEASRTVRLSTGKTTLRVAIGTLGVGVVALNPAEQVCAFEGTSLQIQDGEALLESTGHMMISSIDMTDLRQSAGLLMMPSEPGTVRLRTTQALKVVVGDIVRGKWVVREEMELERKDGWVSLAVDRSRSRSWILFSTSDKQNEYSRWIERLVNK